MSRMEYGYMVFVSHEGDERALTATDIDDAINDGIERMIDNGDIGDEAGQSLSIRVERGPHDH